jgi:hypothetical protein
MRAKRVCGPAALATTIKRFPGIVRSSARPLALSLPAGPTLVAAENRKDEAVRLLSRPARAKWGCCQKQHTLIPMLLSMQLLCPIACLLHDPYTKVASYRREKNGHREQRDDDSPACFVIFAFISL